MFNIGDNIKSIRQERGLSQDELAELARLNRVTIAKYESGKVEPGAQALTRIADALETTVDQLLGRSSPESPKEDELFTLREQLRRDPEYRILFDAASNVSPENLRKAAAILKALESTNPDYNDGY